MTDCPSSGAISGVLYVPADPLGDSRITEDCWYLDTISADNPGLCALSDMLGVGAQVFTADELSGILESIGFDKNLL